jgi:hypothetical protein
MEEEEPLTNKLSSQPSSSHSMSQALVTPVDSNHVSMEDNEDQSTDSGRFALEQTSRHKSVVWKHFTRKKIGGKDKSECNHCHKCLAGGAKAGTTHLHDHIKICPRLKHNNMKQYILATNNATVNAEKTIENWQFVQDAGRRDLAMMIILHEYPLSMVDHYGFRKYSNTLQPLFKMITRNTVKKDIHKIYNVERDKTIKLLEKTKSRIAITTDMWTSSNQKKGYMAITAHFIDNSWRLQSRIIRYLSNVNHFFFNSY